MVDNKKPVAQQGAKPGAGEAQPPSMGWKELYLKEDWWAIYLGLGIVVGCAHRFPERQHCR